jgi:hypothetical protein
MRKSEHDDIEVESDFSSTRTGVNWYRNIAYAPLTRRPFLIPVCNLCMGT